MQGNPTITLRPVQADDIPRWFEVIDQTWRVAYKDIFPESVFAQREARREERIDRVRHAMASENHHHIVACADDVVVGIMVCGPQSIEKPALDRPTGEVYAIYVLDDFQGLGIGRQLIDQAKALLRQDGFEQMVIWCLRDNPHIGFYTKIGGVQYKESSFEQEGKTYPVVGFVYELGEGEHGENP